MPASKEKSKFKVGDWVVIQLGGIKAQVLEDIGPLGSIESTSTWS
jgi:hypothetical protein